MKKDIKMGERKQRKGGYDLAREIAWNNRKQLDSQRWKLVLETNEKYSKVIAAYKKAIDTLNQWPAKADPELYRIKTSFQPNEISLTRWYLEFSSLPHEKEVKKSNNDTETYIRERKAEYVKAKRIELFRDNQRFEAFYLSVSIEQLEKKYLKEKELEKTSDYIQTPRELQEAFPDFGPISVEVCLYGLTPAEGDGSATEED